MTIKWLNSINSIDELRQKYKELLIKYHPDNNKDDTTLQMQEINSEYDYLIKKLKGGLTITTYVNILDDLFYLGQPSSVNSDFQNFKKY